MLVTSQTVVWFSRRTRVETWWPRRLQQWFNFVVLAAHFGYLSRLLGHT